MNRILSCDKKFAIVTSLIALFGFFLRIWGLYAQPLSGDDIGVAISAVNYMERGQVGPTMWNHPHLRDILVYWTLQLFGKGVWGVKTVSLVFGTLSVPLLALVTNRLFNRPGVAWLAAFFLAVDPLHIDYSRQAVQEIYMAFFTLCGIYLALRSQERVRPVSLVFAAFFFGLGIASKWYVAFPLFVTCAYLFYNVARNNRLIRSEKACRLTFAGAVLLVIPMMVYLVTFIPWFRRGYDLPEWISFQQAMFVESKVHMGYSRYSLEIDHNAYLWFLKPVAYVDAIFGEGEPIFLLAISNPFVWLFTIPALVYLAYRGFSEKRKEYYFVLALFWLTYLQFLVLNRPLWAHTAFSILPFAFMASAYFIIETLKSRKSGKIILSAYLLLVITTSTPLYLMAIGKGRDIPFLKQLVETYRPSFEKQ